MPGTLASVLANAAGQPPPLGSITRAIAAQGRGDDTMLAHINPREAMLLRAHGGSGAINPRTGLPEFDDGGGNSVADLMVRGVNTPYSGAPLGGALPTTGVFAPTAYSGPVASMLPSAQSLVDSYGAGGWGTPTAIQQGADVPLYAENAFNSALKTDPNSALYSVTMNGQPNYGVYMPSQPGGAVMNQPLATIPYDPGVNQGNLYRDYMQPQLAGQAIGGSPSSGTAYTFGAGGATPTAAEIAQSSATNKMEHLPFNPIGLMALMAPLAIGGGATALGAIPAGAGADAAGAGLLDATAAGIPADAAAAAPADVGASTGVAGDSPLFLGASSAADAGGAIGGDAPLFGAAGGSAGGASGSTLGGILSSPAGTIGKALIGPLLGTALMPGGSGGSSGASASSPPPSPNVVGAYNNPPLSSMHPLAPNAVQLQIANPTLPWYKVPGIFAP